MASDDYQKIYESIRAASAGIWEVAEPQEMILTEADTNVYDNIRAVLASTREKAFQAINSAMIGSYWEIGRQISEAVGDRAEYGKQLLRFLSERLTEEFGKGFDMRNLRYMRQFYRTFPIRNTLCSELSWSHYRLLMKIEEPKRRDFYLKECVECAWTVRQLERQIYSNSLSENSRSNGCLEFSSSVISSPLS